MRLSHLLLAGFALVPATAIAQTTSDTRNFTVIGSVPGSCAISSPDLAPGQQVNFRGLNGNTLQIDQLVDPFTLSTNAASVEVAFDAVCSFPHRLIVETQNNGLFQTAEATIIPPTGFGFGIPYTASVRWADENLVVLADARSRRIVESSVFVNGVSAGELLVRLDIGPGATNLRNNSPLLAGVYGDTLRITLEPRS